MKPKKNLFYMVEKIDGSKPYFKVLEEACLSSHKELDRQNISNLLDLEKILVYGTKEK